MPRWKTAFSATTSWRTRYTWSSLYDLRRQTGLQDFTGIAPLDLVYVADFGRMEGAGMDDKVMYSAADTGFIAQNVYLCCAAEGLATVVRGLLDRQALGEAMGLDARPENRTRPDRWLSRGVSGFPCGLPLRAPSDAQEMLRQYRTMTFDAEAACHPYLFRDPSNSRSQALARTQLAIAAAPIAPDWRAISRPPRNRAMVGMLRILKRCASP